MASPGGDATAAEPDAAGGRTVRTCPLPHALVIVPRPGLSDDESRAVMTALSEMGLHEHPERSPGVGARYFELDDALHHTVYDLRGPLNHRLGAHLRAVVFEQMPFLSPFAYEPRDEHCSLQWNMPLIQAPQAWDITRGDPAIIIAIVDSGVDLAHRGLNVLLGFNLMDPSRYGGPVLDDVGELDAHGTHVAGIAAATIGNAIGVAGVAGRCTILPLATEGATDVQLAAGITRAVSTSGVRVINISMSGWYLALCRRHGIP